MELCEAEILGKLWAHSRRKTGLKILQHRSLSSHIHISFGIGQGRRPLPLACKKQSAEIDSLADYDSEI